MAVIIFYQIEAHINDYWEAIPGHTYACPIGSFRRMFELLTLTMNQRIKRIGDIKNFPEGKDWAPTFLYSPMRHRLRDWPASRGT